MGSNYSVVLVIFCSYSIIADNVDVESVLKKDYINENMSVSDVSTDERKKNKIFKKKVRLTAEKSFYIASAFPLGGQIYNWKVLGIESYKKTLIFGSVFLTLAGFYIYNFAKYSDSESSQSIASRHYRWKTYSLSLFLICSVVSSLDAYLTLYKKAHNFSDELTCINNDFFE